MTKNDIIQLRLQNQNLSSHSFQSSADIVRWFGAVQSQDFAGAKWALATRLGVVTESEIDKAFDAGAILRTHVLRPTWHFVLPEDIRWMVRLTEPRISAFSAKYFKDLGLDNSVFKKSNKIIVKALEEGLHLTKKELGERLDKARIDTSGLRLTYIIFRAELDALVCSGQRNGKQFTYAILDQRAPKTKRLEGDEALHELSMRYFTSRGPATIKDFAWWSGLSAADARRAVALSELLHEDLGPETFYFTSSAISGPAKKILTHLLPSWDEYAVAYKDRSLIVQSKFEADAGKGIFNPIVIVNGQIKGTWKRAVKNTCVEMDVRYFEEQSKAVLQKVSTTAGMYAKYLNKKLILV